MTALKRLLLFNLTTDADDPVFGFTTTWINALARHCEQIDVLTMQCGRLAVTQGVHVYSVGRECGYSEPRRAVEFYRILIPLLLRYHYDACFAHMQPLFVIMAAPLLRPKCVPITFWYAHKAVSLRLRLAEKWADHVVTASPESFRLPSPKVIVTGHGIDTTLFAPDSGMSETRPFTILSVSRIAPVKRIELLIEAARLLSARGVAFRLRIVGDAERQHRAYLEQLRRLAAAPAFTGSVEFVGSVRYEQVAALYHDADVMVNLSDTGSIDKAVLEAMSCGLPVITANEAFTAMLSTWRDRLLVAPDAGALANRLAQMAATPAEERAALGWALREIVVREHSLERLIRQLVGEILLR